MFDKLLNVVRFLSFVVIDSYYNAFDFLLLTLCFDSILPFVDD